MTVLRLQKIELSPFRIAPQRSPMTAAKRVTDSILLVIGKPFADCVIYVAGRVL